MVSTAKEENKTQIISESDDSDLISLEELANTSNNQTSNLESDAEILLGAFGENQHPIRKESPSDVTKNPVAKTLFHAGLIGVVLLFICLVWMLLSGTQEKPLEPLALTPEEVEDEQAQKIKELEDSLYRERAQVAVRNLQSPLSNEGQKKKSTTSKTQAQKKSASQTSTTASATPSSQPTTATRPASAPPPPPPPPPRRAAPSPVQTLPVQATRPIPTPAVATPTSIAASTVTPSTVTPKEEFDDLSMWSELATLGQVQQTNIQPNANLQQVSQPTQEIETVETNEVSNSPIASIMVGNEPIPQAQNIATENDLTPGMQGILYQTSDYADPNYKDVQVSIGATAQGEVVVPLHWNQEIDGSDGMFVVRLTEPLIADDGTPVFEVGTQLIVSVSFVSDAGQVFQSVMAVVHPDGRQETIPVTGSGYNDAPVTPLLLRGKKGDVLIAEKIEGSKRGAGMGNDLAVGLMAGVSEAANNITQPDQHIQTQTSGFSSSSISQRNRREPEAAFIKGLTSTLTERMTARLDTKPQELKIFQVDRGEKVLLFVNGFVTFRVPTGRG